MSSTSSVSFITCDTSYLWNGINYISSGNNNVSPNSNGCDSIATLNLTINNSSSSSEIKCDSYIWDGSPVDNIADILIHISIH